MKVEAVLVLDDLAFDGLAHFRCHDLAGLDAHFDEFLEFCQ